MHDTINALVRSFSLWIVLVGFWFMLLPPTVTLTLYPAPTREAIQAAIDAIEANPRIDGGVVQFPGATIELDQPLLWSGNGPALELRGTGSGEPTVFEVGARFEGAPIRPRS